MADQSGIQGFLQAQQGTHTASQANVPGSVNNGNPNTPYNWSSYKPTVTPTPGGLPAVSFNLVTAEAPASSPGYVPPFTADPYAAMVLGNLPQAQGNDNVNRILSSIFGGGSGGGGTGGGGFTPNPSTPATTPPGTTPGPVTRPGPGLRPPGTGSQAGPIGPISGPIARDPLNQGSNYQNAQPNTNLTDSGLGREGALPWLNTPAFQQSQVPATGDSALDGLGRALSGIANTVGAQIGAEWDNLVSDLSGTNGWQGILRQVLNGIAPGLGSFVPEPTSNTPLPTPAEEAAITNRLNSQLSGMIQSITARGGADAQARLEGFMNSSRQGAQAIYDRAPEMSTREANALAERLGFVSWFQGGGAHDIGTENMQEAEDWTTAIRDRFTRRQ